MSDHTQDDQATHIPVLGFVGQSVLIPVCPDPENCQNHQDHATRYVALASLNQPDAGARPFTDLNFTDKNVKQLSGLRWCSNCEITGDKAKLFACAACGNTPYRVFYCSRQCQKANWKEHKPYCSVIQTEYNNAHLRVITPDQTIERSWFKIYSANRTAFNWAAGQAFRCNPQHDPSKTILHISLGSVDKGSVNLPFCPVTFQFRRLKPGQIRGENLKPDRPLHNLGWYTLNDTDASKVGFAVAIEPNDCGSQIIRPDTVIPQWSYILTQSIEGCMTDYVRARLRFFVLLLVANSESGKPLTAFITPRFGNELNMNFDAYLKWRQMTLELIATNQFASTLFNGEYKPKMKHGRIQFYARDE